MKPILFGTIGIFLGGSSILLPLAARAQTRDPRQQLENLILASSLDRPGMHPWHLRMSFDLYDLYDSRKEESGFIEEWWASPTQRKIVVTSPSYNSTNQSTHPADRESYLVHRLLAQVVHPVPDYRDFDHLDVAVKQTTIREDETVLYRDRDDQE